MDFGYFSNKNELLYFNGNDDLYALKANTTETISLEIVKWDDGDYSWLQSSPSGQGKVYYTIHVKNANIICTIYDGNKTMNVKSNQDGILKFKVKTSKEAVPLKIKLNK